MPVVSIRYRADPRPPPWSAVALGLLAGLGLAGHGVLLLAALHPGPWPSSPMLDELLIWARADTWPKEGDRYLYVGGVAVSLVVLLTGGSAFGARAQRLRSSRAVRTVTLLALMPVLVLVLELAALRGGPPPLLPTLLIATISLAAVAVPLAVLDLCRHPGVPTPTAGQDDERGSAQRRMNRDRSRWRPLRLGASVACAIAITSSLWVTDPSALASYVMRVDAFHHWTYFAVAPGHAHLMGVTPILGSYSQYGLGGPIVLAEVARLFGGFSYADVLRVGADYIPIYFVGLFLLILVWQRSVLWAAAGVTLAILVQNFNGVAPGDLLLIHPSSTVLRSALDVWMLLLLVLYTRLPHRAFLVAAAIVAGLALYLETDTGLYLVATFAAFLSLRVFSRVVSGTFSARSALEAVAMLLLAASTFITAAAITVGPAVFEAGFWSSFTWPIRVFLSGYGMLPTPPPSWDAAHAYLTPAIYAVAVILPLTTIACCGRVWEEGIVMSVVGVYGLLLYEQYVGRSHPWNWFHVSIPVLLIGVSFGAAATRRLDSLGSVGRPDRLALAAARAVAIALPSTLLVLGLTLLLGNSSFHEQMSLAVHDEDAWTIAHAGFASSDPDERRVSAVVARIRELVPPGHKVAVLSELDHLYYVLSERIPFTPYVPVYPVVLTKTQEEETLAALREGGPEYVFLERRRGHSDWSAELPRVLLDEVPRHYGFQEVVGGFEVWRRR
jgi:hypothetical protein